MTKTNSAFVKWTASVEDAARRVLGRADRDVSWLLGAPEDMRECFDGGMSPEEYVKAQIEQPE
ncbi:hypothetical protein [Burkholderia ubonensis]|uniref:hypothetical protein n=1 Tax=Burkholderia ubonensis TaxID=101571 RepID=UPI0007720E3D|nr:hypothetical protein [Burkholderia ubonensis]KVT98632.1 hypothetical protein WK61_09385 [Burkholderia ubonensis]